MKKSLKFLPIALLFAFLAFDSSCADDWPTFRRDTGRSGFVDTQLNPAMFQQSWVWKSQLSPEPAWDGPARWDAFAAIRDLPAMRNYDSCFHPVSDGESVFFGSSSQDTLFALDIANGKEKWKFVASGPIRLAPTIVKEKVLFGCDDGFVYCVNKNSGKLIWKFSPAVFQKAEPRRVLNNDRLISFYPIRTGIAVRDGIAYFGASFLPWRESFFCGINIETGKVDSKNSFVTKHADATLEGSLLIADNRVIVGPLLFECLS